MSVKEIRKKTGLSQREFAEKYQIPLQTLKQWESDEGSSSHRKPPEYVCKCQYPYVQKVEYFNVQ